ncbi:hypothetical protein DAI22_01g421650 [Oryza sativa Japonica Group]|nr:hypothetical protein DAI22_01g421650 [Oryza sativa Japonica Group]
MTYYTRWPRHTLVLARTRDTRTPTPPPSGSLHLQVTSLTKFAHVLR